MDHTTSPLNDWTFPETILACYTTILVEVVSGRQISIGLNSDSNINILSWFNPNSLGFVQNCIEIWSLGIVRSKGAKGIEQKPECTTAMQVREPEWNMCVLLLGLPWYLDHIDKGVFKRLVLTICIFAPVTFGWTLLVFYNWNIQLSWLKFFLFICEKIAIYRKGEIICCRAF